MGKGSLPKKLRDAIMGPPLPAHMRQYDLAIPWYVRFWRSIGPPKSTSSQPHGLNRSQGRLVRVAMGVAAILIVGGGLYFYLFANREGRSMAAMEDGVKSVAKIDYKGSIPKFTNAISIWPGNAEAYLLRGNAYAAMGDATEAKRDWDKATQVNPELADAYTARGTQSRIEGDNQQALTQLSRSIQLHPSVDAYYQRGQLYSTLRDYQKAINDFDLSIAERRDAPYVYRARSAARRAMGDIAGANQDRNTADGIEGIRSNVFTAR